VVNLSTGGGSFTLSVEKESGIPLIDIPVYVFSSSGSYLGINAQTDAQGQVSFDLADGDYKFRADYFGYQFWSNDYTVPGTLSDVLSIVHQDVVVTVNQVNGIDIDPLEGVNVYLFTGSGSYQGINQPTDANGQVIFNVPEKDYKVRADYMSAQYWSDVFSWQDVGVDINHGTAILHVTHKGQDLYDVPVYLFTETGSYLGRLERTDSSGEVQFLLPANSYKFRVDYDGTQYWSEVIFIIPHEENNIDLQLELLADLTHDPNPVRFDGVPPVYQPEKVMVASLGSIRGLLIQSVVGQTGENQKIYYFINDHLGTPQKLLNENADVVWSADYKPFGEADVYIETFENRFRLPGQYYDSETGLHYNYHRYYDPSIGRYLRADPIGLLGGTNLFLYANTNPINFIDPLGLETLYERIHPSFFNDLKKYNPVEHNLFTKYTKGINTDLWTDDIRWLELSWKKFDPYSRQEAADMISEGCEETYKSIYGPGSWLGKYLGGLPRLLFGTHSDIDTVGSATSLIEITREATNIMIIGPAVVNEKTWQDAFGRPYTPGLR